LKNERRKREIKNEYEEWRLKTESMKGGKEK
jgi:hypothetical protein